MIEAERHPRLLGREIRERDPRLATLLAAQARPEGGIHHPLDRRPIGDVRDIGPPLLERLRRVTAKVRLDSLRDSAGGRVGGFGHDITVAWEEFGGQAVKRQRRRSGGQTTTAAVNKSVVRGENPSAASSDRRSTRPPPHSTVISRHFPCLNLTSESTHRVA